MNRRFVFMLGSTRPDGNAERLARIAADQLPADTEQRWLRLADLPLEPFEDRRHDGAGLYPEPAGHARTLLDATLDATDLVIVSPLYWYSVSTSTKLYLDHWSGWMRVPGLDFTPKMRSAERTLWGVTSYAADRSGADPLVGTLKHCADYFGMRWGGALLGNGNRPGDVINDEDALLAAKTFFTA